MCGRYTHLFTWEELHRLSSLTAPAIELGFSYNVAPTQPAPVIRADGDRQRRLDFLKWGLIPSWAKDASIGNSLINARAETVKDKPAFRAAVKARRCIVPISGFFEWKAPNDQKRKQPMYITAANERPMLLAGLWEHWTGDGGIDSFTIITTTANEMMSNMQDRMPVILDTCDIGAWLSAPEPPLGLLRPCSSEALMFRPVSARVNNPKNNDAACIEPEAEEGSLF